MTYGIFVSGCEKNHGEVMNRIKQLKEEKNKIIVYTSSESIDNKISSDLQEMNIICVRLNITGVISKYIDMVNDLLTDDFESVFKNKVNEIITSNTYNEMNEELLPIVIKFLMEGKDVSVYDEGQEIFEPFTYLNSENGGNKKALILEYLKSTLYELGYSDEDVEYYTLEEAMEQVSMCLDWN